MGKRKHKTRQESPQEAKPETPKPGLLTWTWPMFASIGSVILGWLTFANGVNLLKNYCFPNSRTAIERAEADSKAIQLDLKNNGASPSKIVDFRLILPPELPIDEPQLELVRNANARFPIVDLGATKLRLTVGELRTRKVCKDEMTRLLERDQTVAMRIELDVEETGPWWRPFSKKPFVAPRSAGFSAEDTREFILGRIPDYDVDCIPAA